MEFKKDFDVGIPSAFYLEYRENGKVMKVAMDFRDPYPLLSYRAILSWEQPHDKEVISEAKKREILKNIVFYLDQVRKFKFETEGGTYIDSKRYRQ